MAAYPVIFDVQRQERYDKTQVAIRLVILIVLSLVGVAFSWGSGLIYLGVPVVAVIMISQRGGEQYVAGAEQNMTKWLRMLMRAYAYIALLTDTYPSEDAAHPARFSIAPAGTPSAGGTLLRIITAIPHAIVLGILGIVAFVLLIVAGVQILLSERYSESIFNFVSGYLRWHGRVFAYMAGLVQEYPPFSLGSGPEETSPTVTPQPM